MDARLVTRKATIKRHKDQVLRVIELKFDKSHLNKEQREFLLRLFLEGKWFYNYCIGCKKLKDADTKAKTVPVKLKDGSFEERPLKVLAGQLKQGIQNRIFSNIKTLHTLKMQGVKVGRIGFKPRFDSIPLKQHKGTHAVLVDQNLVTIAKAPKPFKVNGMDQFPKNIDGTLKQVEFANANLIQRDGDYYLQVFCYASKDEEYVNKQHEINQNRKGQAIGFDFGCSTQLTGFTNENKDEGFKVKFDIPVDKITRRLDRKIARKLDKKTPKKDRKNSKNRIKDLKKRRKRLQRLKNRKKDIRKKLVSCITKNYEVVVVQDENIKGWQKGGHGKKIQNTGIGGIMADLKNKSRTLIIVDRFFASTKTCSNCGAVKDKMPQWERTYVCPHCGAIMCRDMNAAKNILTEGLKQHKKIAREPSELKKTLGESLTSTVNTIKTLRGIARVDCKPSSLNQEAPAFRRG